MSYLLLHDTDDRPLCLPADGIVALPAGSANGLPRQFEAGDRRYTKANDGFWYSQAARRTRTVKEPSLDRYQRIAAHVEAATSDALPIRCTEPELEAARESYVAAGGRLSLLGAVVSWLQHPDQKHRVRETPEEIFAMLDGKTVASLRDKIALDAMQLLPPEKYAAAVARHQPPTSPDDVIP